MKVRPFSPQKTPKPLISKDNLEVLHSFIKSSNPLDLEIGCGVGLHPIQYAFNNPVRNIIAIEQTTNKFKKFQRRYHSHNSPSNLLPIHSDACHWVSHYMAPESIDRYFILYPNPYPLNKQKNLRWVNMPFMNYLIQTLKIDGTITLATNKKNYFLEAQEMFKNYWHLNTIDIQKYQQGDIYGRTHFERKYLNQNQTTYNLTMSKKKNHF